MDAGIGFPRHQGREEPLGPGDTPLGNDALDRVRRRERPRGARRTDRRRRPCADGGNDAAVATHPRDGSPSVVYGSDAITFAHWDGTSWVDETIDTVGAFDHSPSLAYGPEGSPSISYVAQGGVSRDQVRVEEGHVLVHRQRRPGCDGRTRQLLGVRRRGPAGNLSWQGSGRPARNPDRSPRTGGLVEGRGRRSHSGSGVPSQPDAQPERSAGCGLREGREDDRR